MYTSTQTIQLFTVASPLQVAIDLLQSAFNQIQSSLIQLKLVLDAKKTKCMIITRSRVSITHYTISTLVGTHLERVTSYRYLGIWLNDKLTYTVHINSLFFFF